MAYPLIRDALTCWSGLPATILNEFNARLQKFLVREHRDDGTHGAVTATGLAVTGTVAVTGATALTGTLSVSGALTASSTVSAPGPVTIAGSAIGRWTSVANNAGDYTASAGTWTLGTQRQRKFTVIDKTMIYKFDILGTSVSNAGVNLFMALPAGFVSADFVTVPIRIVDAGASAIGLALAAPGDTKLTFVANAAATGFGIAAASTAILGVVTLEVQ